jgi:hypothetical protein
LLDLSLRADPIAATPIKELPGRLFIRLGHIDVGAEDMIDVETVLLLHKCQMAFIAGVNGPHCYVGKDYEMYQRSIGRGGFEYA